VTHWLSSLRAKNEGKWYHSYTAYGVGCALAWAVLWTVLAFSASSQELDKVLLVFIGWLIGWTGATIARYFYARPRSR
jgi:hypothetical protein